MTPCDEIMTYEALSTYGKQATGEKYLVRPNTDL